MATKALTDPFVRGASAPKGKRLELTDARCMGLTLRVTDAGSKTFYFTYWSPVLRKMARIRIGNYPDVTLAAARGKADEYRGLVAAGRDPQPEKIEDRETAGATFKEVREKFIELYAKPRNKSWDQAERYLKRAGVEWDLDRRPIKSITPRDIAKKLAEFAAKTPVAANRMHSHLHKMLRWARQPGQGYIEANPLADVDKPGKEVAKDRLLDDQEIQTLWAGLDDPKLPCLRPIALALKMILLTAARPGMVAGMHRAELVNLDGEEPEWHLQGKRMKNALPFILPLSKTAVSIVKEAMPEEDQRVVFRSKFHDKASIERHSLSQAVIAICEHLNMEKWTPHDLRRTAATLAARAGADDSWVQALLSHIPPGVTKIYNRYDKLKEKRQAVDVLALQLSSILAKKKAA